MSIILSWCEWFDYKLPKRGYKYIFHNGFFTFREPEPRANPTEPNLIGALWPLESRRVALKIIDSESYSVRRRACLFTAIVRREGRSAYLVRVHQSHRKASRGGENMYSRIWTNLI